MRKDFKKKYKQAKMSFCNKLLDETVKTDSARWNAEIKKLIANGGIRDDGRLEEAPELRHLDDQEKADFMAEQIEKITLDYEEIDVDATKEKFCAGELELVTHDNVLAALKGMKIPKRMHASDPPPPPPTG